MNQWDDKRTVAGRALEAIKYGVDLPPEPTQADDGGAREEERCAWCGHSRSGHVAKTPCEYSSACSCANFLEPAPTPSEPGEEGAREALDEIFMRIEGQSGWIFDEIRAIRNKALASKAGNTDEG